MPGLPPPPRAIPSATAPAPLPNNAATRASPAKARPPSDAMKRVVRRYGPGLESAFRLRTAQAATSAEVAPGLISDRNSSTRKTVRSTTPGENNSLADEPDHGVAFSQAAMRSSSSVRCMANSRSVLME